MMNEADKNFYARVAGFTSFFVSAFAIGSVLGWSVFGLSLPVHDPYVFWLVVGVVAAASFGTWAVVREW